MKRKFILFALVVLSLIYGFIIVNPSSTEKIYTPVPTDTTSFMLGAMHNHADYNHTFIDDTFKMNLWHLYTGNQDTVSYKPMGWAPSDSLFSDYSNYHSDVEVFLRKFAGQENPPVYMKMLMMRPKIEYLCYGQRSDYQCEPVSGGDYYWFYAFQQQLTGTPVTDSGSAVVYCQRNQNQTDGGAGWVVKRLKANNEQNNIFKRQHWDDSQYRWYIKPRIRIDSAFANNSTNWDKKVCKIKIIGCDNSTLKDVDIKVSNFLNPSTLHYEGQYLEEYNTLPLTDSLSIQGAWGSTSYYSGWNVRGNNTDSTQDINKTDIQVYWYGNCDMWIDYVRVENEIADQLFKGDRDNWIEWESDIANYNTGSFKSQYKFYIEELDFNNVPCIEYVNKKLQQLTAPNTVDMMVCFWWQNFTAHIPYDMIQQSRWSTAHNIDAATINHVFLEKCNIRTFFTETYPFTGNDIGQSSISKIPNTLPYSSTSGGCVWGTAVSTTEYEAWLQNQLDSGGYPNPQDDGDNPLSMSRDPGLFTWALKIGDSIAKISGREFVNMPQTHLWRFNGVETRREPTNEEIKLTTNIALSYGAKGIINFWYGGDGTCRDTLFGKGYLNSGDGPGQVKRTSNAYEQPKWDSLVKLHQQVRKIAPYFYSFNTQFTNSYIYYQSGERSSFLSTYFNDIKTYAPDINDNPSTADDADHTYLQAATFKNSNTNEQYNHYFMLVNRRCSPYRPDISENGGRRYVKVKFDANPTELSAFNNWKIINVSDSSVVATFDKQTSSYIDLGWYMPGEGRLYKIAPVMTEGGTLVVNESFGGVSFTCKDTVLNDTKDITITGTNSTISFTDSAAIVMTGGTFQSSTPAGSGPGNKNTFQGFNSHKWGGLRFNGSTVKIYDAKFLDISSPAVNHAVKMVDCPLGDIRNNIFTMSTDTSGAVYAAYFDNPFVPPSFSGLYINYNTITMNSSRTNAIQVQGFSGLTLPMYCENNTMTSGGYAKGIMLTSITGGVVNHNSITGFALGIYSILSSIDLFGNYVTNSSSLSEGILATDGSFLNMTNNGMLVTGGMNVLTNTYDGASVNLHVVNATYEILEGTNVFDITTSVNSGAYHIYGSFPQFVYYNDNQSYNCFKYDGLEIEDPDLPVYSVTEGGNPVTLDFIPYQCWAPEPGGSTIVDIGNGLYDTIPTVGGGEGGSQPGTVKPPAATAQTLHDSISMQVRYRNYNSAKNKCYELIGNYPDSIQSLRSLPVLFLSVISSDTSAFAMAGLKTFYENLILNHPGNTAMVIISNYLVQKCKVRLREFTSALSGFQEIINNNPYSYLGLLARWDYMATSLLIQGQGGGERGLSDLGSGISDLKSEEIFQYLDDNPQSENRNPNSTGDKNPFTKEQRQDIRKSINTAIEISKNDDETKIKKLEEKSELGDVNASKELTQMKSLKQVVKTEKPKSIIEHMNIVNNDIQAVFSKDIKVSSKQQNSVPTVFSLSQNFPNPFNPVTTIKYTLPQDVKVIMKIYDILGREVKVLVNEIQKAGYYDAKFDGTNLASGVYFYRIEAGDFVMAKKMVLVK